MHFFHFCWQLISGIYFQLNLISFNCCIWEVGKENVPVEPPEEATWKEFLVQTSVFYYQGLENIKPSNWLCVCMCVCVWNTVCICELLCYSAKVLLAWFRAVKFSPHIVVFCRKGGQMLKLALISGRFWNNPSRQSTAVTLISKDKKVQMFRFNQRKARISVVRHRWRYNKVQGRVRGNVFVDVSIWCTMSFDFCSVSCFSALSLGV